MSAQPTIVAITLEDGTNVLLPSSVSYGQFVRNNAIFGSGVYYVYFSDGTREVIGSSGGLYSETGESGIVAFAGGGQVGAYQLTARNSRVDTVATVGDSVKFLSAIKQLKQTVQNNDPSEDMDVYPSLGDNFLGLAVNEPISVAPGNQLTIYVYNTGELTPI